MAINGVPEHLGSRHYFVTWISLRVLSVLAAREDMEQFDAFGQHAEFARHVARIREPLDDFSPFTNEALIEPNSLNHPAEAIASCP
jgi:hypothetical protein